MEYSPEDRELAETMIVLTGDGAREAAVQFAADCRDRGNDAMGEQWERVAASIDEITHAAAAEPAAADPASGERGAVAAWSSGFVHALYETYASPPRHEAALFDMHQAVPA